MWYEVKMVNETLDALQQAIDNSPIGVDIILCLNCQTYIEDPLPGIDQNDLFSEFLDHPILKDANIIRKTMDEEFYNIGDWRRDIYGEEYDYKYIVWGESDCLIPEDYFFLLNSIDIDSPHILTLAQRQMWDDTWHIIEHRGIREIEQQNYHTYTEVLGTGDKRMNPPFYSGDYISLEQLNDFNRQYDPELIKLPHLKVDGNKVALSRGLPYPFLPTDLHFAREDYCLQVFLNSKKIPQYHIHTRINGHNRNHPNKRMFTDDTRDRGRYKAYEREAFKSINKFIKELQDEKNTYNR